MGLYGAMRTSASGMAAQANRISAVSDNISNASTTGYKRSSIEFASLVLESGTSDYQPGAVESNIRRLISEQGGFSFTSSSTDLAVKGNGFFVVSGPSDQVFLTRAGSFVANAEGDLVNAGGFKLLGLNISGPNAGVVINGAAGLEPVNLSELTLQATPTDEGSFFVNLPSNATSVAAGSRPSDNVAGSTSTAKSSLLAFDSLGNEVMIDIYTTKTASETWEVSVFARANAGPTGAFPYSSGPLATQTLTFNSTNGQLAGASATNIAIPIPGGATLTLDMSQSTQLATGYVVLGAELNGNAPSEVERVEISDVGIVSAVYRNGARLDAYRIPLATVTSPDNLRVQTGNVFLPSFDSGDIQVGVAGSGGLGTLSSNALEQSTVDLANELTNMIEAQRSYTANSKVFQTSADLLNVLVNLQG